MKRSSFHVALLACALSLAVLALPNRSLAQAPTFDTLIATPVTVDSGFPENATVGDINGDGKLDAIIPGIGGLRVLVGNGNGTFFDRLLGLADVTTSNVVNLHPSLPGFLPRPVGGTGDLKAVDVNRDGKLDLVCVTTVGINFTNYSFISVLINTGVNDANGVPLFTTTHHWSPFLGVRPVTVGDLNGDNWPDLIIGTCCNGIQVWTSNVGTGTFTPGQVTSLTPGAGGPSVGWGVIADLNGDGKADYVVTSNQNHGANVFFGNGDGTLQTPASYLPNGAVSVAVADVNGDGKPDLLMGDTTSGAEGLLVYLNNGLGPFGAPILYAIPGFSSSFNGGATVAVADINGDGKHDAVLSNTNSNTIAVLLGDGNGVFGAPIMFAANFVPTHVFVGDFSSDGKPDIGVVLRNLRSFGVLTNTTVFAPSDTTPPTVSAPAPLTVECNTTGGVSTSDPAIQGWLASAGASDDVDGAVPVSNDLVAGTCAVGATKTVTFSATDSAGNTGSATSTITVVDTVAPSIGSATASPNVLWPPNHRMVPVSVAAAVTDACDAGATCQMLSVTSNEPVNGLGDGDTAPDWVVTGPLTVDLRAERSGKGSGRVYTITIQCTDASGNRATRDVTVTVPKSQGKGNDDDDDDKDDKDKHKAKDKDKNKDKDKKKDGVGKGVRHR